MRIAIAGATGLVGRRLTTAARAAGHDVLELSRAQGVDLTSGAGLDLAGVEAVVDVTNSPSVEQGPATEFFTAVAERLGAAAGEAGVRRTVVLSIIGVDRTPQDGYFVAKLAHERAAREHAPGVHVLRAAQFHDFAGQILGWTRQGDTATVPDLPTQPVDLGVVVDALLALATGADQRDHGELAGPRPERLPDLVRRLVAARGEDVTVTATAPSAEAAAGAALPGPDATLAGPDFDTWLTREVPAGAAAGPR